MKNSKPLLILDRFIIYRHLFREKKFSLIELLVVIAIIFILMSILLPSLKSVREEARRIECLGRLKEWGIATENYVQDHDGFICWGFSGLGYLQWSHFDYIGQYMGAKSSGGNKEYGPQCPVYVKEYSGITTIAGVNGRYGLVKPYSTNGDYWQNVYTDEVPWKMMMVKNPSSKFLILDTAKYFAIYSYQNVYGTIPLTDTIMYSACARHRLRFNSVHYDGHGDTYKAAAAGTEENDKHVESMQFWH